MIRRYIVESALGVLIRALGLAPIVLINFTRQISNELALAVYAWGTMLVIHASLVVPIVTVCVMRGRLIWPGGSLFLGLGAALCALLAWLSPWQEWAAPLSWLALTCINIRADFRLLHGSRTLAYQFSQSLKNIGLIIAILAFPASGPELFWGAAAGELLKLIWVQRGEQPGEQPGEQLGWRALPGSTSLQDAKDLGRYSLQMMAMTALVFVERTTILLADPQAIVTYDVLYRFLDVPLTMVTAGALPLFLSHYRHDKGAKVQRMALLASSSVTLALLAAVVPFAPAIVDALNVTSIQQHLEYVLVLLVLTVPALTMLVFLRRELANLKWPAHYAFYLAMAAARIALGLAVYAFDLQQWVLVIVVAGSAVLYYIEASVISGVVRRHERVTGVATAVRSS